MKGIIFNLLEQFVSENWGDKVYEEILNECSLETKGPFVGPGSYPDSDLMAIVSKGVEKSGIALPELLRKFGRFCIPILAEKFPDFVTPYKHPRDFLKTVDNIIHLEVKKLWEDAKPPGFVLREPDSGRLIMEYRSERKLCKFMEGLIEGVGDYYNTLIQYRQTRCMLNGEDVCEFDLTFSHKSEDN